MLEDAIEKAVGQIQEQAPSQEGQAPVVETQPAPGNDSAATKTEVTGQTENAPKEPDSKSTPVVWDGDVNKLPDELKEQAKAVQRYTTRIQTEAAEARKRAQELEAKLAERNQAPTPAPQPDNSVLVSQDEWEDALLDTSGAKVSSLLKRVVGSEVEKAKREAQVVLGQVQEKQSLVEWETRINEFAAANPDFITLHKAGIMQPIFKQVIAAGGGIEEAYAEAKKIAEFFRTQAETQAQGRVNQKKDASVTGKTPVGKVEFIPATDPDDAFNKAFDNAWEKKHVRVKVTARK